MSNKLYHSEVSDAVRHLCFVMGCEKQMKKLSNKKLALSLTLILLAFAGRVGAQQPYSGSLPIIIITTDTTPVDIHGKTGATMTIIYSKTAGHYSLSDTNNASLVNYKGRIGIKTRGHTSLHSPKKSYSIETRKADNVSNNNVSLMGMPKENDWVLNALFLDNSYIRDALTYEIGRRTGHYAPRTHHCELFVNGDYKGLYMLSEKIKADKNRVDITKMSPADTMDDALTGGYIFKADHPDEEEPVAWTTTSLAGDMDVTYIIHYPKPENIAPQQLEYLREYFDAFERAARRFDTTEATGYPGIIDVTSFVDYMLVCELASNADSYQYSTFFHKDRNGKLCAGPLWDFNQAYGNDPKGRDGYDVWQFDNGSNTGSTFWNNFFKRKYFHRKMEKRWQQLTGNGPLSIDSTMALIDSLSDALRQAAINDRQRWENVSDYSQSIDSLKHWLRMRYAWMDEQLRPTTGIDNPYFSTNRLSVFPNPTDGWLNIRLPDDFSPTSGMNAEIFDMAGTRMMTLSIKNNNAAIDIKSLPKGLYTLRIATDEGHQCNQTIIRR